MSYCELTTLDKEFLRNLIDNQTNRICESIRELRILVHEDAEEILRQTKEESYK